MAYTPAPSLALIRQPSATAQSGVAIARLPIVQLRKADCTNDTTAGVTVTVTVTGPTLTKTPTTLTTDAGGAARLTSLMLTGLIGNYSLHFSAPGYGSIDSQVIALAAGPLSPADCAAATAGGDVGDPVTIAVLLLDAEGNKCIGANPTVVVGPVPGGEPNAGKTFTITNNGDGTASAVYHPTVAGTDDVPVTVNGVAVVGSPVAVPVQALPVGGLIYDLAIEAKALGSVTGSSAWPTYLGPWSGATSMACERLWAVQRGPVITNPDGSKSCNPITTHTDSAYSFDPTVSKPYADAPDYAPLGGHVLMLKLRQNDVGPTPTVCTADSYRCAPSPPYTMFGETLAARATAQGVSNREYWYHESTFVPSSFPDIPDNCDWTWVQLQESYNRGGGGVTSIGLYLTNPGPNYRVWSHYGVWGSYRDSDISAEFAALVPATRGVWFHWLWHVRIGETPTSGFIEVWYATGIAPVTYQNIVLTPRAGVSTVATVNGVSRLTYQTMPSRFKNGGLCHGLDFYCGHWNAAPNVNPPDMAMYFAWAKVGSSRASVVLPEAA